MPDRASNIYFKNRENGGIVPAIHIQQRQLSTAVHNENNLRTQTHFSRIHQITDLLIKPENCQIIVGKLSYEEKEKIQVRSRFAYNGIIYNLVITDPVIEYIYKKRGVGRYKLNSDPIYYCISLGVPYDGYCYKLIAGIISKEFSKERLNFQRRWAKSKGVSFPSKMDADTVATKLEEIAKQYLDATAEIEKVKERMDEEAKDLIEIKSKLEKRISTVKKPYEDRISEMESNINKLEKNMLEYHPGEKKIHDTKHGKILFKISRSLQIKDKSRAIDILKENDMLDKGIKVYKRPIHNLKKKGFVEDDVAYYKSRKNIVVKKRIILDVHDSRLYKRLKKERQKLSNKESVPVYYVFNNETLKSFAKKKPKTREDLLKIKGVGKVKSRKYGDRFIKIIQKYS